MSERPRRRRRRPPRSRIVLRWLGLAALVVVASLYVAPVRSYLRTRHALRERRDEVRALQLQKKTLERRLASTTMPATVTREARRLGYIKQGERLFIVNGIAAWRRAVRAATIARGG